ncbi:MAG: vWA domain-containing protein [Acidithiobacillus ferrivorans]
MKALEVVAAALGRSMGLRVEFDLDAPTAYTDGRRIVLPELPLLAGEDLETVVLGLMVHEAGHNRLRSIQEPPAGITVTPFIKGLQNGLEDIRIEEGMMRLYRGGKRHLEKIIEYGIRVGWFDPNPVKARPADLVDFGLLFKFRHERLGQNALAQAATNWETAAIATLGEALWRQIVAIAEPATRASSVDAPDGPWHAAQKIANLLSQVAQNGNTGGQPQNRRGNSSGNKVAKAAQKAVDATEKQVSATDLGAIVEDKGGTKKVIRQDAGGGSASSDSCPVIVCATGGNLDPSVLPTADKLYRKTAGPLEAKLWARAQEEVFAARTGTGGVVTHVLHRVHTDARVFSRRVEGESRNMAVLMLVDNSGSMRHQGSAKHPMHHAAAGMVALGRLFSSLGIEYAADGFDDAYFVRKPFGSLPVTMSTNLPVTGGGCTNLARAVSIGVTRLIQRDEEKKILLVLTDARVGASEEYRLAVVDREAGRVGVDVRYVCITPDRIHWSFAGKRLGVADVEDTGKALIGAFAQSI